MALQEKYKDLIAIAQAENVTDLQIAENNNVLYINGNTNAFTKTKLWDTYNKIDPDFATGDLVLNIDAPVLAAGTKLKVVTASSNLNIRSGASTSDAIVGKAAHHEIVTLVNQTNEQWWEIKTDQGEQGYAYTQYLTPAE